MSAAVAARRHRLGRALRIGTLSWYVLPGPRTGGLVAVDHDGRVAAVGPAARAALRRRGGLRSLLRGLPSLQA